MKKSPFLLIFLILMGISFVSDCSEDDLWESGSKTYQFITIDSTSPAQDSVNIPKNTRIVVEFSEEMNRSTFSAAFSLTTGSNSVALSNYTVSWNTANTLVTLSDPVTELTGDRIYNLTLNTSLRSASGNPMQDSYHVAFTTGSFSDSTAPNLSSHCIKAGGGDLCEPDITIDGETAYLITALEFTFDEAMIPVSVENSFSLEVDSNPVIPTSVTWSDFNTKVVFSFSAVPSGSAVLNLDAQGLDAGGNPLSNPITDETFTVGGGNIVDYTITSPNIPTNGFSSGSYSGSFIITNVGSIGGSSNVTWTVYRSTDAVSLMLEVFWRAQGLSQRFQLRPPLQRLVLVEHGLLQLEHTIY